MGLLLCWVEAKPSRLGPSSSPGTHIRSSGAWQLSAGTAETAQASASQRHLSEGPFLSGTMDVVSSTAIVVTSGRT